MATSLLSGWPALVRISVETVDALDRIKSGAGTATARAAAAATIQPFRLAYGHEAWTSRYMPASVGCDRIYRLR